MTDVETYARLGLIISGSVHGALLPWLIAWIWHSDRLGHYQFAATASVVAGSVGTLLILAYWVHRLTERMDRDFSDKEASK